MRTQPQSFSYIHGVISILVASFPMPGMCISTTMSTECTLTFVGGVTYSKKSVNHSMYVARDFKQRIATIPSIIQVSVC